MITDEEIYVQAGAYGIGITPKENLLGFARLIEQRAREEEREACARACDKEADAWFKLKLPDYREVARDCAKLIRARGNHEHH